MAAAEPLDLENPRRLRETLERFSDDDLELLTARLRWRAIARKKQLPPDNNKWDFFGIKSGRGFGKTVSGARWLADAALVDPGSYNFVIAPTHEDLVTTCFYGPTGLHGAYEDKAGLIGPPGRQYPILPKKLIKDSTKSPPVITLTNSAIIRGFSADTPERLRGPQCHRGWLDEVASWRFAEKAFDNFVFGLRLGKHPQVFWTGTPKPKPFIKMLMSLPRSITISGSTYENAENLSDIFYDNIAKYEGTRIGRQEIYGEIIDPEEAGFVKRSDIRLWPAGKPLPKFRFVVMSLDTAFTEETWNKKEQTGDPTACTVWGLFEYERREHVMLLHAWEQYLGFPALVRQVKYEYTMRYGDQDEPLLRPALISKDRRPARTGRAIDHLLIEDTGSGKSLIQVLAEEGVFAERFPTDMDKLSKLHAASPMFAHGRVWTPESKVTPGHPRPWAEKVISQLCCYVGEGSLAHDDLLDTCVTAETCILTPTGPRAISTIQVGDLVLTHKGRWRPVTKTMQRISPHVYRFKAKTLDEISITGNHPAWVSSIRYQDAAYREAGEPHFKPIAEIRPRSMYILNRNGKGVQCPMSSKHDAIMLPRYVPEAVRVSIDVLQFCPRPDLQVSDSVVRLEHSRAKEVFRHIPLTSETGFVFGLFMAEGCVTSRRGVKNSINWACDEAAIKTCARVLKGQFGVRDVLISNEDTHWRANVGSVPLAAVFETLGYLAENKAVPGWVYDAPEDFVRGFIEGYAHGDGHVTKSTQTTSITSTSWVALWGVRVLLTRLGISAYINLSKSAGVRTINGKTSQCLDAWVLSYQATPRYAGTACWRPEGAAYWVEKNERVEGGFRGFDVYNLSVEEDESYVTTGGTVHNCTQALLFFMRKYKISLTVRQDPVKAIIAASERLKQQRRSNPYDG
jgi:predicted phage terminase large subunit-like protein